MDKKWLSLNVGGTYFTTTRSTLIKNTPSSSPLHRISSNSTNVHWDRDNTGAYLIDRDPEYFRAILNFFRTRRLILSPNIPEEAILCEAEYFNIANLIRILKQRISSRCNDPTATIISMDNESQPPKANHSAADLKNYSSIVERRRLMIGVNSGILSLGSK